MNPPSNLAIDRGAQAGACFHCGEALPSDPRSVDGQPVCCAGCEAAVLLIHGAGLDAYYRLRSAPAPRADAPRHEDWTAYDREAVQRRFVARNTDGSREAVLWVQDLRCAACSWLVEHALDRLTGVKEARLNSATGRLLLRWDPAQVMLSVLLDELATLGYRPHPLDDSSGDAMMVRERRDALKRLWVAGLGMMQVMMFAITVYMDGGQGMEADMRQLFNWVSLILTTPVVLYSAQPFFINAWRGLRALHPGMDLPVSIAVLLAYTASVAVTLGGGEEVYFDSVAMFVFFLLAGRWFEMNARHRAGRATEALNRLVPDVAERIAPAAGFVGAEELLPDDRVRVRAGDRFPCDGMIVTGSTLADESLLTGESTPVARGPGSRIVAGALNLHAPVEVRVTAAGMETLVSGIGRLLARAQGERPRIALAADLVARWFVIGLLVVASVVFATWLVLDAPRALPITLAVLVVACPCALALATPTAVTAGTLALARRGLLVTRADAVEVLGRADTVVFDKTGTLTHGDMRILDAQDADAHTLAIAAALEREAEHPAARAFRSADTGLVTRDVRHIRHHGIEGLVEGQRWRIGRPDWVARGADKDELESGAATHVALGDDNGIVARFRLGDASRPGTRRVLDRLRDMGLEIEILSGDNEGAVAAAAAELGVTRWRARMSPQDKLARVRELQHSNPPRRVVVVGDGVNDAPVLAGADASIALENGSALAQTAASAVLLGQSLGNLPRGFADARRTLHIIRQNIGLSLAYNVSTVPLAAIGLVPPWLAAIGMSASSLVVVLNALRLK